jgi:hypothetical protein
MIRPATLTLTTMALLAFAVALPAGHADAQEKQHVSFKSPAENSKYIQQLNVEAGDVPNHIVRIFDIHRTYPNGPTINGLKIVEETDRGTTDIIDGNGTSVVYSVYTMENGDKFFARLAQLNKKNGARISATGVGEIAGGTGKMANIHGVVQFIANFDTTTGFNENQVDIDYSIGR